MITVASIVFSITIANLDNEVMKYPLLTFAVGSFFSLLFAIFAIIPSTTYPKIKGTQEIDRKSPLFNPLFFGHFAHLPIEEYKEDYDEREERGKNFSIMSTISFKLSNKEMKALSEYLQGLY